MNASTHTQGYSDIPPSQRVLGIAQPSTYKGCALVFLTIGILGLTTSPSFAAKNTRWSWSNETRQENIRGNRTAGNQHTQRAEEQPMSSEEEREQRDKQRQEGNGEQPMSSEEEREQRQ